MSAIVQNNSNRPNIRPQKTRGFFETRLLNLSYNPCVMNTKLLVLQNLRENTDGELIAQAITGREESFEEIVRRYQRPITNYVYRMLGNYDASLDVTQEIFIKVYNSMARYSAEYRFSTWLYKIAHNAAIDYLRRNSNHEQSLEIESDDGTYEVQYESKRLNPEQERERSEWREEIKTVVRRLPAGYRELIVLRHDNDLSYDEIAEITNLPLGTVKNRLFRAREMMREIFLERGFTGI
jgi:RNA polymerase sigma-70 factor (ECF subfamily)